VIPNPPIAGKIDRRDEQSILTRIAGKTVAGYGHSPDVARAIRNEEEENDR
jgi:hypothetical protein